MFYPFFEMDIVKQLSAYILASRLRTGVLKALYNGYRRQMQIAKHCNKKQQNISNALYQLEKKNLVECLTPEKKAWKIYRLTKLGKEVTEKISDYS
ncbi:MAG: winged helix-turn-helix transcriptional regulator [Candidatus Thorarchaeota archaeon]